MVSKKTPTKCIQDCRIHRHHRRKPHSTAIIESINRSVLTCQRRLRKILSKLTHLGTPIKNRRHNLFKTLRKTPIKQTEQDEEELQSLVPRTLFSDSKPLPSPTPPSKPTIFLDLDETLIHSKPNPPPDRFDFIVRPKIDGEIIDFYVLKRPGVDDFLEALGSKFEVVVFTAGLKEYASLVLDELDQKNVISHRLYRDSCKQHEGVKYVKDLSDLGRDLKRVVILDDNPNAYVFQPENAIPIKPFINDASDGELDKLKGFLEVCHYYEDMRDAVKYYLSGLK